MVLEENYVTKLTDNTSSKCLTEKMFCVEHYGFSGLNHILDMFLIALDHLTLGIFYNLQKHPNNVSIRSRCHQVKVKKTIFILKGQLRHMIPCQPCI